MNTPIPTLAERLSTHAEVSAFQPRAQTVDGVDFWFLRTGKLPYQKGVFAEIQGVPISISYISHLGTYRVSVDGVPFKRGISDSTTARRRAIKRAKEVASQR